MTAVPDTTAHTTRTFAVRAIDDHELRDAGELTLAAYLALEWPIIDPGYRDELADVDARAAEAAVLVAVDTEEGGGLLGSVTYVDGPANRYAEFTDEDAAGMRMLAVRPEAQGRRVGDALVAACIDRARRDGKAKLVLHTTTWMPAARRLYERLGFQRDEQRDWRPVPEVELLGYVFPIS